MNCIFELLLEIEKNVKLYIGDCDLHALKHLITGYYLCLHPAPNSREACEWQDFSQSVSNYFNDNRSISMFTCISEHTSSKEEAFKIFFELLHQYIASHNCTQ